MAFDLQNYYNIQVNVMWQFMQNFKTLYGNWTKQTKSKTHADLLPVTSA